MIIFIFDSVRFVSYEIKCLLNLFNRANVQGKDISLYVNTKHKHATSSAMKKPDFKAAIDQIEAALQGNDAAPTSYDVNTNFALIHFVHFINQTKNHTTDLKTKKQTKSIFAWFVLNDLKSILQVAHATFNSTLNSTLDTTGASANNTKLDDSQLEDDNDDADVEPEDKNGAAENVQENEAESEINEVNKLHPLFMMVSF